VTTTEIQYTSLLGHGLGMIDETRILLDLWQPGIESLELQKLALESGSFANVSARRIKNIVSDCFVRRYLVEDGRPAQLLKLLMPHVSGRELGQLLFIYTCRANRILADFVREVYWEAYATGRTEIDNTLAREFVAKASRNGLTASLWPESTVRRVASYLTGACADFGLLDSGNRTRRAIIPLRIESRIVTILAHDLHFAGLTDNRMVAADDWQLFALEPPDVLSELRRLAAKSAFIVQTAGTTTKISWQCKTPEDLARVIAEE